jgi:hypothetical protein
MTSALATPHEIVAFFSQAKDLRLDGFRDAVIGNHTVIRHSNGRRLWHANSAYSYITDIGFVNVDNNGVSRIAKPTIDGDTFSLEVVVEDSGGVQSILLPVSFVRKNAKNNLAAAIEEYLTSTDASVSSSVTAVLAKALQEHLVAEK